MKKMLSFALAAMLLMLFSCAEPTSGGGSPETNPLDDIADTTITGSVISNQDELFETGPIVAGMMYMMATKNLLEDETLKLPELLNAPAGNARTLVNGISMTNYKGTASYDYSDTFTQEVDDATGTFVIDADLTTDNNIDWKSIEWNDTQVLYVPEDLTIFEGTDGITGGELTFTITVLSDCEIGQYSLDTDNGILTLEKGVFSVEMSMDMTISNVDMDVYTSINIDGDEVPTVDIDSGVVNMDFSYSVSLAAAVSSTDPAYKGGKIICTAAMNRNIDGLNISGWDEELENAGSDAYYDVVKSQAERLFGDFETATVSVTVYDAENTEVYSDDLVYEDFFVEVEDSASSDE